ncbi:MAG: cytochrome c3 family protein [Sterolibacterium sp.]|nr:cytochrome c3 family protein [Sterolibacterium sp.]
MTSLRGSFPVILLLTIASVLCARSNPVEAVEASAKKAAPASAPSVRKSASPGSLAPLPSKPTPASSHAPFESGDCKICHQNSDPKQPGPVTKQGPAMCLECHEEFAGIMKRPHTHPPARTACTSCHNPHNSNSRKLLVQEPLALCTGCHDKIGKLASSASVPHKALSTGAQCSNCHNPHGSAVEKLLVQLPFDLCVNCHNVDTMVDAKGKKLQNIKGWLEKNKEQHGPVAAKDCSACHEPHGGEHFRLLNADYPQEFYAPYDARNYELCFSCHQEKAFSTAQTTTLTSFRNGGTNLHYLHLQQSGRGRTCRACHEVHASQQKHHIREGVPYGSGGWMLKLFYKKSATGGSCEKTCHSEKTYVNKNAR